MSASLNEQETVIQISRDEDVAHIWTSDTMMMTKLDHRVEDSEEWTCEEVQKIDGEVFAKTYICPKNFISFRGKKTQRVLTDEQKKAIADRLKASRNAQHQKISRIPIEA